jgi:hypothetical protein
MKNLILTLLLLISFTSYSQNFYNIVVFSDDGEKFILFINGVQQNNEPQSNVQATNLTSQASSLRLEFTNLAYPVLKQNLYAEPGYEHTMRVKKTKKKAIKLQYFGKTPLSNTSMGQPVNHGEFNVAEESTQTQTNSGTPSNNQTPSNENSVNVIDINTGDNSAVVNIILPENSNPKYPNQNTTMPVDNVSVTNSSNCLTPLNVASFESFKKLVQEKPFSETKLSTAKAGTKNACLTSEQIKSICDLFMIDNDKLEYAKFAYTYCFNKANYVSVSKSFKFTNTTKEFNNFLENQN